MEKQELDKQESNVEDLTVSEDIAAEVKGGAEPSGPMKESMETMKKAWKDSSTII